MTSSSPLLEEGRQERATSAVLDTHHRLASIPRLRLKGGDDNMLKLGGGMCCCLVICLLLFSSMFSAVILPNHVGIQYNSLTKHTDTSKTFPPGRYWQGPFNKYIMFPTTLQVVHLEMVSRTNEGFPIDLTVTVQYRLQRDKIIELYKEFNIKYEQVFIRNIRDSMMRAISEYSAQDFYQIRKKILDEMETIARARLDTTYAEVWSIQFDDVAQSTQFESTLLQAQMQNWYARTKMKEQEVSAVKAHTAVIRAQFDKNISIVNSTATSECAFITSTASAQASIYTQEADANATLIIDQAKATGTRIVQEALAKAELVYQTALAESNSFVLREKAHADQRNTAVQGLQLKYWKNIVGLSETGLVEFQKIGGQAYKQLEDVNFLFGFENTYATADVGKLSQNAMPTVSSDPPPQQLQAASPSMAQAVELAAITGHAAGSAAAGSGSSSQLSSNIASGAAAALRASAPGRALSDLPALGNADGSDATRLEQEWAQELHMNPLQMPQWETFMEL